MCEMCICSGSEMRGLSASTVASSFKAHHLHCKVSPLNTNPNGKAEVRLSLREKEGIKLQV